MNTCGYFTQTYNDLENFRDINGFPNLGPKTLIRGHPRGSEVVPLDSMGMISYYLLIVLEAVSCTISEI